MKKILLILCLFPILVFSQKSYKIPADSTILNNIGSGKNELVIRNATSNITGGVLTNLGNGVTAFVLGGGSARVVDTIYKNNTKDSIVFTISGIRYAVKDSIGVTDLSGYALQSSLNDTASTLRRIRKVDSSYLFKNATRDSICMVTVINGSTYRTCAFDSSIVNTDAQTLTAGVNTLTISGGNTVDLNRKVDSSYSFRNASLDSICQIVIINGNPTRSCIKDSTGGGGASLSGLTAATASNTIDNAANVQEWQWNSLTSGSGFILKSNNSGLFGATSSVLEVNSTGSSAGNNTTNALKLVNNRSGTGTNVGADITVSGNVGAIGLNITNATSTGKGINLTSGMAQGIQMNNNMLAFSTTPHSIKYTGSYFHINSASSRTFFTATGTSNYWAFCTSDASNFITINRVANGSYALIFGGDYPGAYRSELTSNNVIKASNGSLTICGNTGLAGGFGGFTPTEIITVYGTNTNVGIGTTTPVASAKLQISSTTSGFLPPVMTATQASAISTPAQGLLLFVSDTNGTFTSVGWWGYNGSTWEKLNN